MKSALFVGLVAACGVAAFAFHQWRRHEIPAGSTQAPGIAGAGPRVLTSSGPRSIDAAEIGAARPPSSPLVPDAAAPPDEPRYAQPVEIENMILQFLAQRPGLQVVSINSVKCDATTCEIAISGLELNPTKAERDVLQELIRERWAEFRFVSGSTGSREIAPGARESVVSFEYQAMQDVSDDPKIAARQQAACAAAWRRQTTNPTPADIVRQYLEFAERHLALAAAELGRPEAERLAEQTKGGPLIRECGLWPPPR